MSDSKQGRWLCEEWAEHIGPAVTAMTGQQGTASLLAGSSSQPDPEGLLIWRQPFDASPGAELWVAVSAAVWSQIGRLVLSSAGLEEDDSAEIQGTFLEVLQQSLSPLCSVLGSRLQREVHIHSGEPVDRLPESTGWQAIQVHVDGQATGNIWVACNAALLEVVEIPVTSSRTGLDHSDGRKSSKTMDLLMEVELPVGVSFGRAQMRLKDAIKLTTGSIVELNRSISEPVEIIVNNCVIARGDVVVMDGNYGVRIKHIVSREERLRTLF